MCFPPQGKRGARSSRAGTENGKEAARHAVQIQRLQLQQRDL